MRTAMLVCAVTASAFFGPPVWAHLHVIDQFQENQDYLYGVGDSTMMAQTFTAAQTGTLCHVEIGNTTGLAWGDQSPPVVLIREGEPRTEAFGSVTPFYPDSGSYDVFPSNSIVPFDPGGWLTLPFNFPVEQGEMYSIVVWAKSVGSVSVGAVTDPDFYARGDLWATDETGTWQFLWDVDPSSEDPPVFDMQFRTYVQAVPLPAGVWLGICAVGVAGWHLKRQRA